MEQGGLRAIKDIYTGLRMSQNTCSEKSKKNEKERTEKVNPQLQIRLVHADKSMLLGLF